MPSWRSLSYTEVWLEGGGALAPRNLADQLTLFKPGGADYTPHTTASPSGFKKLSTPLMYFFRKIFKFLISWKW